MMEDLIKTEVDLSSIKGVVPKPTFDAREFEGVRTKIAEVRTIIVDSHYVDGNYTADKTTKIDVLEIETEGVTELDVEDENGIKSKKKITARQRFNLQRDSGNNLIFSKHPKAKLWKFMRKLGVEHINDMKGKYVTLTTEASKDDNDDRVWLRISV